MEGKFKLKKSEKFNWIVELQGTKLLGKNVRIVVYVTQRVCGVLMAANSDIAGQANLDTSSSILLGTQEWKLEGEFLKNKAHIYPPPTKQWKFKPEGQYVYIVNTLNNTVLAVDMMDKSVNEEKLVEKYNKQLWIKGPINQDGYFSLVTCSSSGKTLTATSTDTFTILGNNILLFSLLLPRSKSNYVLFIACFVLGHASHHVLGCYEC